MTFDLAPREKQEAEAFLKRRDVLALMRSGGMVAFVFGPSNGIGVPVTVTVKGTDGSIISKDITDVASW